ncbi:MAG: aminotransferase class V-fold PLP-dependent enzyme [Microcoleaceae cyanobacterium]
MTTNFKVDNHRRQFPALNDKAYFNYGGQGPLPRQSIDAITQFYEQIQQLGPFSQAAYDFVQQQQDLTRSAIAVELGVTPQTITITEDVTVGCNIALWGINWQPGDHLLLSDCEHPGIIAATQELQRRFQIEVSVCPILETLNQGDPVAVIADYLQPNTRLVVISHILWNTGQVLPLQQIMQLCHTAQNQPIRVLVDAAQSVGVLPLNLVESDVDFYAFTGHKWLCGPEGIGGLYVSPEALPELSPTFIGWRGVTKDKKGHPTGFQPDGQRYEIATSAYPLYAGLWQAIELHLEWGNAAERYQRIRDYSQMLWQNLSEIPHIQCLKSTPPEAGLVSFTLKNGMSHAAVVNALQKQNIFLRTILDPDCVRACVHYLTEIAEIEQLVTALKSL